MKSLVASILIPVMLAGCAAQPAPGFVVRDVRLVGLDNQPLQEEPSGGDSSAPNSNDARENVSDCSSIPYTENDAYLRCVHDLSDKRFDSETHETAEAVGEFVGYALAAPFYIATGVFQFSYAFALAVLEARYGVGRPVAVQTVAEPDNTPSYGVDDQGRPWSCVGTTCGSANIYIPPNRRAAWTSPQQQ